jgi:signal transduction histidine kinase
MTASLKRRLVWILLGLTLAAWVASAVLTFVFASRVMLDQVDRQLEQYADLVSYVTQVFARQVDEGVPVIEPWFDEAFEQAGSEPMLIHGPGLEGLAPALNVFLDNRLLALLEDSPRFEAPVEEGLEFRRVGTDQRPWRVLTRFDEPSGLWVLVGIELDAARRSLLGILGRALLPLLLVLPLTLGLLYVGVSRGLSPLQALAGQIARRRPGQLDPVVSERVPAELQGVVASLNALLERLATALEGEQRFTANAAHELLTPLAAIKTEVQLCQRQLQGEPGAAMLARITQRVDRASHSVEQLLTLARVDPDIPHVLDPVPLRALLVEVLAELAHLVNERGLEVQLEEGEELVVSGSGELLAILLRNLLGNAVRYATAGSTVHITLGGDPQARLEICNDCPPLSAEEFRRIGERFYRVPGSEGPGAGLGLSIVQRIAALHGALFSVGPGKAGAGFCARVRFTPAARAQRPAAREPAG